MNDCYEIRHYNSCSENYVLLWKGSDRNAAKQHRKVSGDLLFKNGSLDLDQDWWFAWEKTEPNAYVQRVTRYFKESGRIAA